MLIVSTSQSAHRSCGLTLLLTAPLLAVSSSGVMLLVVVILLLLLVAVCLVLARCLVLGGRNPEAGSSAVVHGLVLSGQVKALALLAAALTPALGKRPGAGGELGGNGSVLLDPVGEGVLAVLDDTVTEISIVS